MQDQVKSQLSPQVGSCKGDEARLGKKEENWREDGRNHMLSENMVTSAIFGIQSVLVLPRHNFILSFDSPEKYYL